MSGDRDVPTRHRRAARVIVVDEARRVLLFRGADPARPEAGTWWFTPGGGIDEGERAEDAARREVREETGYVIGDLGPVVLERRIEFEVEGEHFDQEEVFFLVDVTGFDVDDREWTDLERRLVLEHRWWSLADLASTADVVFPDGLAGIVRAVHPPVEVVEAAYADKEVVRRLLELYQHDFSEFNPADVDAHGRYGYRYLDHYWTEPDRRPFLLRVDGHWAGFALVRVGPPHDMAEFFVMRKYRRGGVGKAAARAVFELVPGEWQVRQERANTAATRFWREAIPYPFEESDGDAGPVQRFSTGDAGRE